MESQQKGETMKEEKKQHGRRETPSGPAAWWRQYRQWLAGLSRAQRLRWRALEGAAVVSLAIIAAALYLRSWVRLPEVPSYPDVKPPQPSSSQTGDISSGEVEYVEAELPEVAKSGRREGCYTFLVAGRDVVSGATDTMLLFNYDTKNQQLNAVSLLRDTMVNTSARRGPQKRLNVVLARNMGDSSLPNSQRVEKGMNALRQEVRKLTGIYPDFYVLVEWEAIGKLVDAIGGVEFDVPYDMDYDDDTPGQDLHIHQKKGLRLLNGQDAMEVIRFRKSNKGDPNGISLGDSGRTQIQRDFLTAVVKKCLTPEILLKLPTLAQIFTENVSTDLTVGNILAFAQLAVGMDTESGINFESMPYYNVMYDGASLVVVQQKAMLELLNNGINPYVDEIKAGDLQLMYRKSGGGFGVTNASMLDPQAALPPPPKEPEEEEPGEEEPGEETPGEGEEPGTDPSGSGGTSSGETEQPSESNEPSSSGEINPSGSGSSSGGAADPAGNSSSSQENRENPAAGSESGIAPIDPADVFPNLEPPSQDIIAPAEQ